MRAKYETNVEPKLMQVEAWARDGLIDKQIAKNLGIGYSTFRSFCKNYPALKTALLKGKEVIDFEVENSLLKRALGYDVIETTRELKGGVLVITKEVKKHFVPDVLAQMYWLKNRKPGQWRDRPIDDDRESLGKLDTILAGLGKVMSND